MAGARDRTTSQRRRRSRKGSAWRWIVERLVFLAVAVLVLRSWYFEGLFVRLQVVSGSMADGLWGVHRDVVCLDCGHPFACGADVRPVSPRAVCPNCGCAENDLGGQPDVDGDRVLVEKSIFSLRAARRWEPVAFRDPAQPSRILVKRVVGLPGESVQIREGDVYVDGQIQRKDLLEQRALAVLVHDAGHTPRVDLGLPPRWDDEQVGTGWGGAEGRFAHPAVPGSSSVSWLTYRHWRRVPGRPGKVAEGPITNVRGYNQGRGQRAENIHPVTDLLLSFRVVRIFGEGELWVRATDGCEQFDVRMETGHRSYEVFANGDPLGSAGRGKLPARTADLHVEVSLFDRQFLLAFDGHPAMVWPYQRADPEPSPTSRPLAIGSRGPGVQLRDLRVYRDVYYTHPVGVKGRWGLEQPVRLGADEYFVLGDNSPVSEDSRTWPDGPAVPTSLLVGKPLLVHFPARRIGLGPWHFQVPDPARIRYIR
jgi:signal peptidase I